MVVKNDYATVLDKVQGPDVDLPSSTITKTTMTESIIPKSQRLTWTPNCLVGHSRHLVHLMKSPPNKNLKNLCRVWEIAVSITENNGGEAGNGPRSHHTPSM